MQIASASPYFSDNLGSVAWVQILGVAIPGSTLYKLYRSTTQGVPGSLIATSVGAMFTDDQVAPGGTYYYTMTNVDDVGHEGEPSTEVAATVSNFTPAYNGLVVVDAMPTEPVSIPVSIGTEKTLPVATNPEALFLLGQNVIGTCYTVFSINKALSGDFTIIDFGEYSASASSIALGIDGKTMIAGQINRPKWVIRTESGKLHAVNVPVMKKQLYNGYGTPVPADIPRPICAMQNTDGKFWVTDSGGSRIVIYSESLKFLNAAAEGQPGEALASPGKLAHDSKGRVFCYSAMDKFINIYEPDGRLISRFGDAGDIQGNFMSINGISVDFEDNVWVVDGLAGNIQKFTRDGVYLGILSNPTMDGHPGFTYPISFVRTGQNSAVVGETFFANRLRAVTFL